MTNGSIASDSAFPRSSLNRVGETEGGSDTIPVANWNWVTSLDALTVSFSSHSAGMPSFSADAMIVAARMPHRIEPRIRRAWQTEATIMPTKNTTRSGDAK